MFPKNRLLCMLGLCVPLALSAQSVVEPISAPSAGALDQTQARQRQPTRLNANAPQCRPKYPLAALSNRTEGATRLRVMISGDKIDAVEVVDSSGPTRYHKLLDRAAAEAMARCPVVSGFDTDGKPTSTQIELVQTWRIQ